MFTVHGRSTAMLLVSLIPPCVTLVMPMKTFNIHMGICQSEGNVRELLRVPAAVPAGAAGSDAETETENELRLDIC